MNKSDGSNLTLGIAAGLVAALIAAIVWGLISSTTRFQIAARMRTW
jgi:ethanolamine transporter EutH